MWQGPPRPCLFRIVKKTTPGVTGGIVNAPGVVHLNFTGEAGPGKALPHSTSYIAGTSMRANRTRFSEATSVHAAKISSPARARRGNPAPRAALDEATI